MRYTSIYRMFSDENRRLFSHTYEKRKIESQSQAKFLSVVNSLDEQ